MDIRANVFTLAQVCRVAGVSRSAANMWVRRGKLQPSGSEALAERQRALFSVVAIFAVKLMALMSERLAMGPSATAEFAEQLADDLSHELGDALWSVARESDRGRTLQLLAAVARDKGRWRIVFPELDAGKFIDKFGADVPFAVIPVGRIFAAVYRECEKNYGGEARSRNKGIRRARS